MDDTRERLRKCMQLVFAKLSDEQAYNASPESVEAWDSVATATLFMALEEEFQVSIDYEQAAELNSFEAILRYVRG
jgi:acyl carrier protein